MFNILQIIFETLIIILIIIPTDTSELKKKYLFCKYHKYHYN